MNLENISAVTFGLQAFVTLFVIMDPPGATPIFLSLVKNKPAAIRNRLAWQGAAVSFFCNYTLCTFRSLDFKLLKYFDSSAARRGRFAIAFGFFRIITRR